MKVSTQWLREFIDYKVDEQRLAQDLTMAGLSVEGRSPANGDTVFELEITPNRVDAMNHYGVARDLSAIYDIDLKPLVAKLPNGTGGAAKDVVKIDDAQGCARYSARIMRGVKIGPSPQRILERIAIEDHRGINNAADATNYNLMEMGHPTHAFDLDKLEGGRIIVRRARAGERIKTLDGVERTLHEEDLVIADAAKPVAIAGVIGGWDSMITASTKNVLVESAWFDPATVRKTARRHAIHTDASHRFERGADWGATPLACDRVTQLILETAGGQLEGELIDAVARDLRRPPIELRASEVQRILGKELVEAEIIRILRRLGFGTTVANGSYQVEIPTWRMDVEREIDLIEELARIHGFNNFPNTLPSFSGGVIELPNAHKREKVRSALLALGYNEAISLTFQSAADAKTFAPEKQAVALENPLSDEATTLRNSLVPGMLEMLAWNLNRGSDNVRLFERGHIFSAPADAGDLVAERDALCLGATGATAPASTFAQSRPTTFYDIKGDVESLLANFSGKVAFMPYSGGDGHYHPGRAAGIALDGKLIGAMGQLHPRIAEERKIKQDVFLAELELDLLFAHALREPKYRPIPRFPAVERDFSLLLDDTVSWEKLRDAVQRLGIPELRSVTPADFYAGKNLPAGKHSLLLRVSFQSAERTLRDDEVATWSEQIVKAVQQLGGSLRA